jgi:hypothetical protein
VGVSVLWRGGYHARQGASPPSRPPQVLRRPIPMSGYGWAPRPAGGDRPAARVGFHTTPSTDGRLGLLGEIAQQRAWASIQHLRRTGASACWQAGGRPSAVGCDGESWRASGCRFEPCLAQRRSRDPHLVCLRPPHLARLLSLTHRVSGTSRPEPATGVGRGVAEPSNTHDLAPPVPLWNRVADGPGSVRYSWEAGRPNLMS